DVRDDRLMLAALLPPGPGSLLDLLQPLARRQLSVEHWCARPARVGGWHYRFHFTLQGDPDRGDVRQALQEAAARCRELKILGRFRAARL
ncbi:MAG TPA: chorismate mutase, partial [Burkholderiaceae bacterium]|nr:chorismate mutase [Burkholderiaceae bacterium]